MNEEMYVVFEAPKVDPVEFRLYYNDNGEVISYTCEKPEGNYIVIDRQTYAEMRFDLRIIDGKISRVNPNAIVHKLMPDLIEGMATEKEDMSIIVDESITKNFKKWKLVSYELK